MEQHLAATARRRRRIRYVAPGALGVVAAVCAAVVASPWGSSGPRSRAAAASHATLPRVPPYWTVRPGDTYALISEKTGLTVAMLEAFNPDTGELGLIPGERLNLWAHPPATASKAAWATILDSAQWPVVRVDRRPDRDQPRDA